MTRPPCCPFSTAPTFDFWLPLDLTVPKRDLSDQMYEINPASPWPGPPLWQVEGASVRRLPPASETGRTAQGEGAEWPGDGSWRIRYDTP